MNTVENWLGKDNKLGIDIWNLKYKNENETFDEWLMRVSGNKKEVADAIVNKEFIFGGRILANRGLKKNITYSNCYVVTPPEDNLESIFDTAKNLARTYSYGGGCGVDISKLRPKTAKVNNAAKETSGAVSFMELYNLTTEIIGQNGRRGALMLSIDVSHPDVEEFIKLKSDLNKINKANISIKMNDDFMKAVKEDRKYTLSFDVKDTGEKIEKVVDAKKLFKELAKQNWNYAEPGILFWDKIKNWCLVSEDEEFEFAGTNPCVTGDTLISTTEGYIKIKDLVGHTPHVYCMDDENGGKLTIRQASKVWMTRKNAKLVKVISGKGEITCTPDHKIFTKNRGWVEAKDLKKGDKLKGLNRQTTGHKYCSISLSGDKYIKEHRFVKGHFEDIEGKDVHHLNDNGFDNRLSNLLAETHSEHSVRTNTSRIIEHNRDDLGRYSEKDIKAKRTTKNLGKKVGTNWFIKEVIELDYTEDVYDMTVPEVHNFIANDMVIHNCAEEPLPAGGSCLLGSIVLPTFFKNGVFDEERFKKVVRSSVRALNEVLDEGIDLHPLQEQRETVKEWRQIGLGILGLGELLIKMKIKYDSDEGIKIAKKIGEILSDTALNESALLAKEKGTYAKFKFEEVLSSPYLQYNASKETLKLIKKHGLRNSQLLTIAPTGSIGTMLQTSTGVEPYFAFSYTRKTESLHGEDVFYKVFDKVAKEYMEDNNIEKEEELPEWFVTSQNIDAKKRIEMQGTWQKNIDASISSTVNLPNVATIEEVEELYILAWLHGLKGMTIYRTGCAREGILVTENEEEMLKKIELKRGEVKEIAEDTVYYPKSIITGCGKIKLFIGYSKEEGCVQDLYTVRAGNGGGCDKNITSTVIFMSQVLRLGGNVMDMQKAINGISACASYAKRKGTSKGSSCSSGIMYSIIEFLEEVENENGVKKPIKLKDELNIKVNVETTFKTICPECGEELNPIGGCWTCPSCAFSKCE